MTLTRWAGVCFGIGWLAYADGVRLPSGQAWALMITLMILGALVGAGATE